MCIRDRYSYIVAGIKSGTKIGINPNKISRFIFTKKDGKNNEKEKIKGRDYLCPWSYWPDLNRRPADYESAALPTETQ